jgi:hypothetical protein
MGLGSRIREKPIPEPGSQTRGQKGTGFRIRIRNTDWNSGFSNFFCLMMEESGSGRPKNREPIESGSGFGFESGYTNTEKKTLKTRKKGCAPERCNVEPESLEGCLVLEVLHVEELDGHVAVPVPHVDSAEPTATDLQQIKVSRFKKSFPKSFSMFPVPHVDSAEPTASDLRSICKIIRYTRCTKSQCKKKN